MDKHMLAAKAAQAWNAMAPPGEKPSIGFLHEFIETVLCLDADTHNHNFTARDIAAVEAFWRYSGAEYCWAGGFLLRLRDGRRAYLATECGPDGDWESTGSVKIEMLAKDMAFHNVTPLQPMAWEHHRST
jgi:hypothetical protein